MDGSKSCLNQFGSYIDLFKSSKSKHVVWYFFNRIESQGKAVCKNCWLEIDYGRETSILIDHLKYEHNSGYKSYEEYMEDLCVILQREEYNFPVVNKENLKIKFCDNISNDLTLIRFPLCRQERYHYPEKSQYESNWQKLVCKEYSANPVGSYQGHFDRPININLVLGSSSELLSFSSYTEFSHTNKCRKYDVDKTRYDDLGDLEKIQSLKVVTNATGIHSLKIEGVCSRDKDQRIFYTCTKHGCIFPCLCKDCVEEEGQCEDHCILHYDYFDPEKHAFTVRMHDSHDINRVGDNFRKTNGKTIEVLEYPGIEKDSSICEKCPRDLLHHQAYHFVHHSFCKFCENEKHKYENVTSKKDCVIKMNEKYRLDETSCYICAKLFSTPYYKNIHLKTEHGGDISYLEKCDNCDQTFKSLQAMEYHKKVRHAEIIEQHACPECGKTFNTAHGVDSHSRSVHAFKKFFCSICSQKFTRHSNLLRHYRLVHEIDMNKYSKGIDKQESHACDQCNFKTLYKSNLKEHKDNFHITIKKPTFSCELCSFKTTYKRNLTSHSKIHAESENPIYRCDECEFASSYKRSLDKHKRIKHDKSCP